MTNTDSTRIVPPQRLNPRVRSPLLIIRCTAEGYIGQFEGSRAELVLSYASSAPLHQVVEGVRRRWPNARVAMDGVVIEDHRC